MLGVRTLLLTLAATLLAQSGRAQLSIGQSTTLEFAGLDSARTILTNRDLFVRSLSPFDRASRLKSSAEVSEADYLAFVATNVLVWEDSDRKKITTAFEGLQKNLESLGLPFPEKILLIKTTGLEEGNAAYTRSNAVILPRADLKNPPAELQSTLFHELFHVLSRANPELRERLYAAIGFVKCPELPFPPELKAVKITNPDAPANDHCIQVKVDGSPVWAIPILYSRSEKFDAKRGGEFFNYLEFRLAVVERNENTGAITPVLAANKTRLLNVPQVTGFYEQIGRNTEYIIHPEEILADNFVLVVRRSKSTPSPEVLTKIEAVLKQPPR